MKNLRSVCCLLLCTCVMPDISLGGSCPCQPCIADCDGNGNEDSCDIADGLHADCNGNGIPDTCELDRHAQGLDMPITDIILPPGFEARLFAILSDSTENIVISEGGPFGDRLYVTEDAFSTEGRITSFDTQGISSSFASGFSNMRGLTLGPGGQFGPGLYMVHDAGILSSIDENAIITELTRRLLNPKGFTFGFDGLGFTCKTDVRSGIDSVDSSGKVSEFVRLGKLASCVDVVFGKGQYAGFLYAVNEIQNSIRAIDAFGNLTSFNFGSGLSPHALAFGTGGALGVELYVVSLSGSSAIRVVHPDGSDTLFADFGSSYSGLSGIAFGSGNGIFGHDMFVVQRYPHRIIRISEKSGRDCNNNGLLDECDLEAATSDDCNFNDVPDECESVEDCNNNGIADICDIATGTSVDNNRNGLPDECEPCPVASPPISTNPVVPKNRFLTIIGQDPGTMTAIRVTFFDLPAPYNIFNGETMWVGPPREICENSGQSELVPIAECGPAIGRDPSQPGPTLFVARLRCEPFFMDWTTIPKPVRS